ncbi:ribitol 5-phosphate transferase FKRP-like [Mercenaria mercenaria]|uniref:ribitol 5-phosphate transferase FKRP-like n=1 Tax=Mercenaria mercenaria TaxID=6596 RepID=UPI00234E4F2F|nr:ribitol 5-phosphate transferase FKRP-like [Mercenaria mercenaria]
MTRRLRRRLKFLIIAVICSSAVYMIHSWFQEDDQPAKEIHIVTRKSLDPSLTVVLQDFDPFHNDVYNTVSYIAKNFTAVNVIVITEKLPYPPMKIPKLPNVKLLVMKNDVKKTLNDSRPEYHINTNFVLFVPDGAIVHDYFMRKFKYFVAKYDYMKYEGYAIPLRGTTLKCHGIVFSVKTWTLEIGGKLPTTKCGYVSGDHGILLRTKHLYELSNPFLTPTFMSIYIQLSLIYFKAVILDDLYLISTNNVKPDAQTIWQQKQTHSQKLKNLYSELGVKLVLHENKREEWYGCHKDSFRCFDTVYNDMPEFLYQERWTPPCCLKNLRETAKHVFAILDQNKVRYWLEGGSLLGAARSGDIIPWDYDIDIGIYQEDIIKCDQLRKVAKEGFIDEEGFSWEKAIEGDFYRVQFSDTNHLHVDIFPFYPKNGIMTKNTWIKAHKQDTEFPERFLKPLGRIKFAGLSASAPNHVREFLEYKFGRGVIESPKYPNTMVAG